MTIGKRKGAAAKGTGAAPGNVANSQYGGSLSKNDHWYLQQAFGMSGDPGVGNVPGVEATGGIIGEYVDPGPGTVYRTHTFTASGSFVVSDIGGRDPSSANLDYLIIAGGGGGGGAYEAGGGGAGGSGECAGAGSFGEAGGSGRWRDTDSAPFVLSPSAGRSDQHAAVGEGRRVGAYGGYQCLTVGIRGGGESVAAVSGDEICAGSLWLCGGYDWTGGEFSGGGGRVGQIRECLCEADFSGVGEQGGVSLPRRALDGAGGDRCFRTGAVHVRKQFSAADVQP